jgi:hypothetical protein
MSKLARAALSAAVWIRPQAAEVPLREIGLCLLALIAYMLSRRFLRVLQSAKRRG